MLKRLLLLLFLGAAVAIGGSVTAHPLKKTVTNASDCDALSGKTRSACKTCFTKAKGSAVHYHPAGRKKGNRCHAPEEGGRKTKTKKAKRKAPAGKAPTQPAGGCNCG